MFIAHLRSLAPWIASLISVAGWLPAAHGQSQSQESAPIRVFVLVGQSNMQGHARVETLDYMADDPATVSLLKMIQADDGTARTCPSTWISYLTSDGEQSGVGSGKLTTGFGARGRAAEDGGKIGPELTFGWTMEKKFEEPVLLIKAAWGGKSLYHDFRPPSAGVYPRTEQDIERERYVEADSGKYYRETIAHVKKILANPESVSPELSPSSRLELAGFVWFQGWNDMVNRDVYPSVPVEKDSADTPQNRFAEYSRLMELFIQDVRHDLDAPRLPFVIGVMGVGGLDANASTLEFREAMRAPATSPQILSGAAAERIQAVETAPFWDVKLGEIDAKYAEVRQMAYLLRTENPNHANRDGSMSPEAQKAYLQKFEAELISADEVALRERGASNAGYHYLGCGKTMAQIGQAFAEAILDMQSPARP